MFLFGLSEMLEIYGEIDIFVMFLIEFFVMFDDSDWGFGIMFSFVRLEVGDRVRYGRYVCAVCRYSIIGFRFKEVKVYFSLCNYCYSEGKVFFVVK